MKNDELAVGVGLVLSTLVSLLILARPGCATAQEYSPGRICGGLGAAVKMACQQAEGPGDVCHRLSAKKCRKLADETIMILLRACDEAIRDSADGTI